MRSAHDFKSHIVEFSRPRPYSFADTSIIRVNIILYNNYYYLGMTLSNVSR